MSLVRAAYRRIAASVPRATLPSLAVATSSRLSAVQLLHTPISTSAVALSADAGAEASDGESLVQQITSDWQLDAALGDNSRCMVYFRTPWCPSCHFVEPIFEELARAHGHAIAFLKVADVAQHRSLMQKYEVTAVPMFICFKNGERLPGELVGADEAGLRAAAEQLAAGTEDDSDTD